MFDVRSACPTEYVVQCYSAVQTCCYVSRSLHRGKTIEGMERGFENGEVGRCPLHLQDRVPQIVQRYLPWCGTGRVRQRCTTASMRNPSSFAADNGIIRDTTAIVTVRRAGTTSPTNVLMIYLANVVQTVPPVDLCPHGQQFVIDTQRGITLRWLLRQTV